MRSHLEKQQPLLLLTLSKQTGGNPFVSKKLPSEQEETAGLICWVANRNDSAKVDESDKSARNNCVSHRLIC